MGVANRIPIVTNGLVLNLDAGNYRSYPKSGTTWTDISNNNNNGTLINGPVYNPENGGNIVFDGTNDSVNTGINQLPSGTQNRTTQIWFKRTNTGTADVLFGYGNLSPNGSTFGAYIDASNLIYFWGYNSDTSILYTITSGIWYNLAFTLSSGVLIAYVNGVQTATFSPTISTVLVASILGSNNYEGANYNNFHGNIATYMVYNRALSAQEVSQNYMSLKSRFGL